MKTENQIDPNYSDGIFRNNFPEFDSKINDLTKLLVDIEKESSNFSKIIYYRIKKLNGPKCTCRHHLHERTLEFSDFIFLKLLSKLEINSKMYHYSDSKKTSYEINKLLGHLNQTDSDNVNNFFNQLLIDNLDLKSHKEKIDLLIEQLANQLETITELINKWKNEWISEYHILNSD